MSVTHDLHPSWHAQVNNTINLFGGLSSNPPMFGAYFAFVYSTPISAGASITQVPVVERVTATIPAGGSVSAKRS